MASLEKLFKAFEVLKVYQASYGEEALRKKELMTLPTKDKIANCVTIAENVCSTPLRSVSEFPKFLGLALETFLTCCDDPDSDVRMVADECLNRTIKTLMDTNLGRIQVELYKEIKKNGAQRSLRVALWRFSDLCHLIRPQKCRPYISNILPPLIQVAKRPEESVQETLALVMPKIFEVLGKFTSDVEMKALLKAFFPNLKSHTAAVRRTAATCLNMICQHSRQPNMAYAWLLSTLFDVLIPVSPACNISTVLGILLCLRHIIPNLITQSMSSEEKVLQGKFGSKTAKQSATISVEKLVQVYELLLHFVQHSDHNVVTAAMEALQQLLKSPPPALLKVLLSPEGIHSTHIHLGDMEAFHGSSAASDLGSVASLIADELTLEDDTDCSEIDVLRSRSSGVMANSEDSNEDGESLKQKESPMKIFNYSAIGEDEPLEDTSYKLNEFCPPKLNYVGIGLEKLDCEHYEISGRESPLSEQNVFLATNQFENIGSFTDAEVPLVYCVRLLCASFLLNPVKNTLRPDQAVRVSVKTLALGCLSGIVGIYPRIILSPLSAVEDHVSPVNPYVADVFLYANHTDPQMRGTTALVAGSFIKSALCEGKGHFQKWFTAHCGLEGMIDLQSLTSILMATLSDGAAVAIRLALVSLKMCLVPIFNSTEGHLGLKIIKTLLRLPSNNYWLVKVELLELLPEIPFNVVRFLEICEEPRHADMSDACGLQSEVMNKVVMVLLGDEDTRVRQVATIAFTRLVPRLFFPLDHHNQDPLIAIAREQTNNFLDPILHEGSFPSHSPILGLMPPYDTQSCKATNAILESSLSRILHLLVKAMPSANKHLTMGCLHAISVLSKEYLVTMYPSAWACVLSINGHHISPFVGKNSGAKHTPVTPPSERIEFCLTDGGSLAALVMSLLSSSSIVTDLLAHQHGVRLLGNLFAGAAIKCLQGHKRSAADGSSEEETPWSMLGDGYTITLAKHLLIHLVRMLNVCVHVMEEQHPTVPQPKSSLPSLPNTSSLSPIKRKSKSNADTLPQPSGAPPALHAGKGSPSKSMSIGEKEEKPNRSHASNAFGAFYNLPHYMKIFEVLKGTYSNYKISLDAQSGEKFLSLVRALLYVLGQLLEIATVTEIGQHADELLGYMKSLIVLEPGTTILCVQQLLKSLFGTNMTSQFENPVHAADVKPGHATRLNVPIVSAGFFHYCLDAPYAHLTHSLTGGPFHLAMTNTESKSGDSNWLGWIKNKWERKSPVLSKVIAGKGDKVQLSSYIRLFEPLVIKALKQYTVTSSVELQCQVLQILSQLVQLRVNYCLLDSDQIFIGFVIKQFEYIEEGQIAQAHKLIPRIFHFLVLLSYERYHSKSIIGVPKIIHLCDGLMASGQPPANFAIPALLPVVEDLFLVRGVLYKSDAGKELDTQREVVISMLLRLIHYHEVLDMLVVILQQSYNDCEKWKKLSRQVVDILLPQLQKLEVNIDDQLALDVLHRLLETVTPSVFRPVDVPLKILLGPPCDLTSPKLLQRWLGLNLAILRVLIMQSTEEVVLSRLSELHLASAIGAHFWSFTSTQDEGSSEPMSFSLYSHDIEQVLSEEMLARFLLQVVKIAVTAIRDHTFLPSAVASEINFVCQEMAHLLLYITHMFQSGLYRRVAMACMSVVKSDCKSIAEINNCFIELSIQYPTLTLQWCNVLILLNYDVLSFWKEMLQSPQNQGQKNIVRTSSCLEIVRKGGLILFCDYVCENLNDVEHLTWLIVNHVGELVQLCSEPPVQDLISAVHRNPAASGLFLQAILTRCDNLNKPNLQCRLLSCLEPSHLAQSGTLTTLLIERLLRTPYVALARASHSMACRRFEMLLAEPANDGASQLPLSELDKLLRFLQSKDLVNRHSHLVTLMKKFRHHAFPLAEPFNFNKSGDDTVLQFTTVDKAAFLSLVVQQCQLVNCNREQCVRLLASLDYSDIMATMENKDFNLLLLENALDLGAQMYLSQRKVCGTGTSEEDSPLSPQPHQKGGLALYSAARQILLQSVAHLVSLLPHPPQVYCTKLVCLLSPRELKYRHRLSSLFADQSVWDMLHQVAPAVKAYLEVISTRHAAFAEIPMESISDLGRFCVLTLEFCHWSVHEGRQPSPHAICVSLGVANEILKNVQVAGVLGLVDHTNWVCSAVYALHRVFECVTTEESRLALGDDQRLGEGLGSLEDDQKHVTIACEKMTEMLVWRDSLRQNSVVPNCLSHYLGELVVGLARLPVLNSYSRIPPIATQMGWKPELAKDTQRPMTPLPVELLQERDVLRQFIIRVNTLGWTSRQQFEETWMSLLSVLSAVPVGDSMSHEEEVECAHTASLAIKCITSLLLQTMRLPQPGNPHNSPYLCQPRHKPLAYVYTRPGKKFLIPWSTLQGKRKELLKLGQWSSLGQSNLHQVASMEIEKCCRNTSFGLGQVSLEYLKAAVGVKGNSGKNSSGMGLTSYSAPASYEQRDRILSSTGLDLHSCLHFLLDLYSQWMANAVTSPTASLVLLTEATRSVVLLSDVFTERSQFQWMLDMLLELQRTHPAEDEVLAQYLTLGILKAASVLGLEGDLPAHMTKVVEQSLAGSYLPTKIAALYGSLYVLESGHSETVVPMVSTLSEFCLKHLENMSRNVNENEEFTLATWYVLFYIIENHRDDLADGNLASRVVQICLQLLTFTGPKVSMVVEESIIHSLERLVLGGTISEKDVSSILKLAVERSRQLNPLQSFLSMSLMLACMYLDKGHDNGVQVESSQDEPDSEALISTMERFTLFFDRTKKGYLFEASTITSLFSTLLTEYFPLSDVMNKVIGEFISSQQPYPHMFASVIFHVCEWASRQDQSQMVREWVLLSLSNFTQQSPLSMAIWSLTCVFVSASDNLWLRAMFPYVQQRIGKLENVDRWLFSLAAQDFFKQLSTSSEVEAFLATISVVAKNDTPYMELLKMLTG